MRTITTTILCLLLAVLAGCNRTEGLPTPDPATFGETRVYKAAEEVGKSGETLSPDGAFEDRYLGAGVSLSYFPADNEFKGALINFSGFTTWDVTIEVRLSNGTVLRPEPVKKLKNRGVVPIVLKASEEPFTSWTGSIRASKWDGNYWDG